MSDYKNPIELLIHSTIRIECQTEDGPSSGTGFVFAFLPKGNENIPCVVTNKHVVSGASKGKFHLTLKDKNGEPDLGKHVEINLDNFEKMWISHPDPNIDLVVIPIAQVFNNASSKGINFYYVQLMRENIADSKLLSSISTMEEIIMIGYPNGIWDAKHNLPVIRRGITATHPKLALNGNPEFMIDAACFPGSSGSPVFLANIGSFVNDQGALCAGNRIALLGVLYAGPQHITTGEIKIVEVPTAEKPVSISGIPNNLGLVIHASKVLDFEPILEKLREQQPKST